MLFTRGHLWKIFVSVHKTVRYLIFYTDIYMDYQYIVIQMMSVLQYSHTLMIFSSEVPYVVIKITLSPIVYLWRVRKEKDGAK